MFRKKSIEAILENSGIENHGHHDEGSLKKVLKVRDLISLGMAAVIGAGIFSTIGQAAYDGGPGVTILFVIGALTGGFTEGTAR